MVWLLRSVLGRNEDDPSRDRGTTSLAFGGLDYARPPSTARCRL
jgi:hypothetical protein